MVLGVGFWKSFGVTKIEEKSVKESRKEEAEDYQLMNSLNQRIENLALIPVGCSRIGGRSARV